VVTLKDARRIIEAAESKATELGQPMNIAVADGGGNLIAHVRGLAWQHRYRHQEGVYVTRF
jgi:uncharacterized protein GlcG (DUF336 family)